MCSALRESDYIEEMQEELLLMKALVHGLIGELTDAGLVSRAGVLLRVVRELDDLTDERSRQIQIEIGPHQCPDGTGPASGYCQAAVGRDATRYDEPEAHLEVGPGHVRAAGAHQQEEGLE